MVLALMWQYIFMIGVINTIDMIDMVDTTDVIHCTRTSLRNKRNPVGQ